MYIPQSFIVALLSAPFLAYAQSTANPFNNPSSGYQVTAGKPLALSWKPTTGGTVSLTLRMGNSGDLSTITTIANNIPNDGSYTWDVPADTVRGSSYTIEIASDSDPSETNYTPPFILESTNNAAPTSSGMTMTASTAASSVTPSAFPLPPGVTIDTSYHPSSGSTSRAMSSSSMASMSMSSASASSASMTNTDSTMTTATSSGSSSSASESSASSSANGDLVATMSTSSTSSGGAARATAMAGMLGVVALGALAL